MKQFTTMNENEQTVFSNNTQPLREIKFRAWDKKYNQMLYGGENWKRYPKWYDVDFITNRGVVIWNKLETRLPFSEGGFEYQQIKINPDILIMEFTGLKDKNGNDIYEGDILNWGDNFPSVVEWNNEESAFLLIERKPHKQTRVRYYPRKHTMTAYTNPSEILGNIYENPELVDGTETKPKVLKEAQAKK